jgi:ABC-2 type transport system permease protein
MSTVFNPTIAAITLRGLLGRRRSLLIALPPALLLALTIALRVTTDINSSHDFGWPGVVLGQIGLVTLLPLTAMIIGTSVLGTEVDDSSILHLLATPVSRATVMTPSGSWPRPRRWCSPWCRSPWRRSWRRRGTSTTPGRWT